MEVYVKKYFWTLSILVVMLCSVFTAKAVNHYVEAKYLADSAEARKPSAASAAKPADTKKSKSGDPFAKRNMFCHDCEPEEVAAGGAGGVVGPPGDTVPITSLPLRLVATNIGRDEGESFATVLNTTSNKQGSYWMESEIPDAGAIVRIRGKYVDFKNNTSRRVERIALLAKDQAAPVAATRAPPTTRRGGPKDELLAAIDDGVNKVDDTTFEIDRALVDKVLANPTSVARGARIVPSIKNGKPNGFKLYAIRPSSVYAKIGLMNGDTIHAVNGFELTTPDKALEVYTKVREANSLSVTATRRGKPVTLNYSIK
jgi:general secretion pathway protein C